MSNVETPVAHAEAASEIVNQLRQAMQKIAGFGFITNGQRRRLSPSAAVPDNFLMTVALALESVPDIATVTKLQPAELRDVVNFTIAFRTVATELQVVARGLLDTIEERRADVGRRALRAYSMAKAFNRPMDEGLPVPHVVEMKRTLGRGRPRRVNDGEEQPPPAPPAPAIAPG